MPKRHLTFTLVGWSLAVLSSAALVVSWLASPPPARLAPQVVALPPPVHGDAISCDLSEVLAEIDSDAHPRVDGRDAHQTQSEVDARRAQVEVLLRAGRCDRLGVNGSAVHAINAFEADHWARADAWFHADAGRSGEALEIHLERLSLGQAMQHGTAFDHGIGNAITLSALRELIELAPDLSEAQRAQVRQVLPIVERAPDLDIALDGVAVRLLMASMRDEAGPWDRLFEWRHQVDPVPTDALLQLQRQARSEGLTEDWSAHRDRIEWRFPHARPTTHMIATTTRSDALRDADLQTLRGLVQ